MFDIEGVTPVAGEEARVSAAVDALAKDPHAPREISVRLTIHVYNEYPKHVTVGEDKDGNAITKIVQNAEEEAALLDPVKSEVE